MTFKNALIVLSAYLFVYVPVGGLIGEVTRKWRQQLPGEGLADAGLWIGRLERVIILTFVLVNQYEAIGLLMAAKSILRFSDKKARKQTEYVLVGTLASLAVTLLVGEGAKLLFKL